MSCAYDKERLTSLFSGELDAGQRVELQRHLEGCPDCRQEWEALKNVWHLMGEIPVEASSGNMRAGFQAILNNYSREADSHKSIRQRLTGALKHLWQWQPRLPLAFSLILLMVGLSAGYLLDRPGRSAANTGDQVRQDDRVREDDQVRQLSTQVQEMKQAMMVSLLVNPSPSERIRGVSYTDGINKVNRQVADALLTTLNNDPNVNVRLVTLEALVKFAEDPVVREGLIQSIAQQDSPLMQTAIADVMVKLQEKGSVKSLRELLQKKDINEMVREKIQQSIHRLI